MAAWIPCTVGLLSSARNVLSKALLTANASWINRAIVAGVVPVVIVGVYTLTTGNTLVFEVFGTAITLYFVVLVMLKTNFEVRAATKEHVEALRKSSQEQIETLKQEIGNLLASLQTVVKELSRLMPPATGPASPGDEEKTVETAKPEGAPSLLSRPPDETTKFLLNETLRQGAELFDSKDSIDTRASYMLALLGIILTIFSTAFITYWTSAAPNQLLLTWPTAYWLSLSLTLGVLVALFAALGLEISVLLPRDFHVGIEVISAYQAAVNPKYDLAKIEEGSLRSLIPMMVSNVDAYSRLVPRYKSGAMFTVVSLSLVIEFVILVVATSLGLDSALRTWVSLFVVAVAVLLVALAIWKSLATLRGSRNLSRFQDDRLREFRDLLAKMRAGTK